MNCRHCGGELEAAKESTSSGIGCLIVVIGAVLCLTVVGAVVGLPAILAGLHFMMKRKGLWRCTACEAEFPRKIRWYEFG